MDVYKDTEKFVVNRYAILGFMSCCIFAILGLRRILNRMETSFME